VDNCDVTQPALRWLKVCYDVDKTGTSEVDQHFPLHSLYGC